MPTPLKHSSNMRKHLTNAEKAARQAAEAGLEQNKGHRLRAPAWLSAEARTIFRRTVKRLAGYNLLEPVDTDLLAHYADAMARYQAAVQELSKTSEAHEIQVTQAWSRIALAYAEKLGFSQNARARLARKRAEEPMDAMDQLLGQVEDYVNGDGHGVQ